MILLIPNMRAYDSASARSWLNKVFIASLHSSFAIVLFALTGCASLDRQIDLALFGSDEKIEEVNKQLAAQKVKEEMRNRRDMEEDLLELICKERKSQRLPCTFVRSPLQERAREEAALLAAFYQGLPLQHRNDDALPPAGRPPVDGKGGWALRAAQRNTPYAVLQFWLGDMASQQMLLDKNLGVFGVGVYRKSGGSYYWVLIALD